MSKRFAPRQRDSRLRVIALCLSLLLSAGCATRTRMVPVEATQARHDTHSRIDTILCIDTVRIHNRGDTVYRDRISYRYRYVQRRDSVANSDTIPRLVQIRDELRQGSRLPSGMALLVVVLIGVGIARIGIRHRR